jgi:pyridinium-3,5-bisthiocarboxylic acid mononucleotide nickel chelatase
MAAADQSSILYLDPFAGIAGDMFIASLLDLGLDLAKLHHELSKLPVKGYSLSSKRVMRGAMSAVHFNVEIDAAQQAYRDYAAIKALIGDSALSDRVKRDSLAAFQKLAEAEARIHGMPIEKVHFHEVGAVDSIVDMVGACVGLEIFGIDELWCGPVALGSGGYVQCDHGTMPVPAPATLEIMKGLPIRETKIEKELTTPTGAALVAALAKFGPMPSMTVEKIGYGAGTREKQAIPNVLRAVKGSLQKSGAGDATSDTILEIRANIDDSTPETLGHVADKLLAIGALDVFFAPIQMKKFRPATQLSVLAEPHLLDTVAQILFKEASTFGLRYSEQSRLKLTRRSETFETPYGSVRVKIGIWQGETVSLHPEYDDCRQRADEKGVALKDVTDAARAAARAAH